MVPILGSGDVGELGFCRSLTLVGEEGDGSIELESPLEGETSSVAPMELGWPLEEEAVSFVASMELESPLEGEVSSAVSMELLLDVLLVVSMEPGLPSKDKTSSAASSVAAGVVRPPMSVSWGAAIERKETLACKVFPRHLWNARWGVGGWTVGTVGGTYCTLCAATCEKLFTHEQLPGVLQGMSGRY